MHDARQEAAGFGVGQFSPALGPVPGAHGGDALLVGLGIVVRVASGSRSGLGSAGGVHVLTLPVSFNRGTQGCAGATRSRRVARVRGGSGGLVSVCASVSRPPSE